MACLTSTPHKAGTPAPPRAFRLGPQLFFFALLVLLSAFILFANPDEKRISIYSSAANYSLPVIEHNGQEYVGLFEMLEPLGTVFSKTEGARWKLRYNGVDGEFTAGRTRARVRGQDLNLPANFLMENGRGLVPLTALTILLPRFLGGPVTFHETSRRLFVGSVAVHFTAQVSKTTPPTLVMDFTSPVNPMIATEPGKLRMVFTHEPLVPPGSLTLTFDSKTIPSANYQESNGAAEITVTGTAPLFASFSNDGRTITVAAVPQPSTQMTPAPVTLPAPTVPVTPASPATPAARRYFAVVDASHGGDERGAALTSQLAEKDVTLAFARRLRQELETRGLTTMLIRDGDATLTLDQRANLANATHAAIYICVHAAAEGKGVRLYTALVPAIGEGRGPFLDWNTAQSAFHGLSETAEASLFAEFQRQKVPVRILTAPLRPLNNLISAAVAIEVAPLADDVSALNSTTYQELIASSVAAGVVAVRDKLEAGR
jgi:N-acetylmuramoyl-L-alanine amidase